MNETASIAQAILDLRMVLVERLLKTDLGQEITRLDDAYAALSGQAPPPWRPGPASAAPAPVDEASEIKLNGGPERKISLRVRVQQLLEEAPVRWTYDDVVRELERRGVELTGTDGDRKSSLRTAVWTLVKKKHVTRGEDEGVFWATKYDAELRAPAAAPDEPDDDDPFGPSDPIASFVDEDPFSDPFADDPPSPQVAPRAREEV